MTDRRPAAEHRPRDRRASCRRSRRADTARVGADGARSRGRCCRRWPDRACTSSPRSSAARRQSARSRARRRHRRASTRVRARRRAAISVLCEPHWFNGSLDDLRAVRAAVRVPVLAKDFVVDRRAARHPARWPARTLVLLLAVLHRPRELRALVARPLDLGIEPLVEAHDARELERALDQGRALDRHQQPRPAARSTSTSARAERLRSLVPDDRLVVAESGVNDPPRSSAAAHSASTPHSIGEALMRSARPSAPRRPPSSPPAGCPPTSPPRPRRRGQDLRHRRRRRRTARRPCRRRLHRAERRRWNTARARAPSVRPTLARYARVAAWPRPRSSW